MQKEYCIVNYICFGMSQSSLGGPREDLELVKFAKCVTKHVYIANYICFGRSQWPLGGPGGKSVDQLS